MLPSFAGKLRLTALAFINKRICRRACCVLPAERMPSYIVVTPHLMHLAPLAARNHTTRVQPVFVANGLDPNDIIWLRAICPAVPLIPLQSSLTRNRASLLEHGVIIDYLSEANRGLFCTQDPDCFISDPAFWNSVTLDASTEYASGPFYFKGEAGRPECPLTFLVCLNQPLMREYRRVYQIRAGSTSEPPRRARRLLRAAGYPAGRFLSGFKAYHDTLEQFWIAARHHGFSFRLLPGERQVVHHVGGTSYLYRAFDNLEHADYWPLNVHYFNLRIVELPGCARFRSRFEKLIARHGTARGLLAAFPKYADGWRRRDSDVIIDRMGAASLYRESFA